MHLRSITFAIALFVSCGVTEACAQHPICGHAPEGDLQGKAELLSKFLGSGNLSGQIQTERETIYKNSNEPEAQRQDAYLAYMFCVLIMDDKTLSTGEKIKAINEFKHPLKKSENLDRPLAEPMVPCVRGETVHPTADTFHLQFMVIDDGPVVNSIMAPLRAQNLNAARQLGDAVKAGEISRFTGSASLVIHILGVDMQQLPNQVPYLAGRAICQGMVPVVRSGTGLPTISIPISGYQNLGQASVVLPRAALTASARPQVCIEPNFSLAYPRPITDESFRGRSDMTCGWDGKVPGNTGLFDSLQKGINSHTYFFIRRI